MRINNHSKHKSNRFQYKVLKQVKIKLNIQVKLKITKLLKTGDGCCLVPAPLAVKVKGLLFHLCNRLYYKYFILYLQH